MTLGKLVVIGSVVLLFIFAIVNPSVFFVVTGKTILGRLLVIVTLVGATVRFPEFGVLMAMCYLVGYYLYDGHMERQRRQKHIIERENAQEKEKEKEKGKQEKQEQGKETQQGKQKRNALTPSSYVDNGKYFWSNYISHRKMIGENSVMTQSSRGMEVGKKEYREEVGTL